MFILKSYISTFIVFLAIDLVWLGFIAKKLYAKHLGYIMAKNINWTAAIIFYMIFVGGILFFVVNPALAKDSISYAIFVGGLFGFITYATYDLTNLSTIEGWPLFITIVDLIWGSFFIRRHKSWKFFDYKDVFLKIGHYTRGYL